MPGPDEPLVERLLPEHGPPAQVALGLPAPPAAPEPPPRTRRHRLDARCGDAVRSVVGRLPAATAVTRHTTDLGSMFMVTTAGAVLAAAGRRRVAGELVVGGALGWVTAQEVKKAFDRPRPYQSEGIRRLIPEPTGSSMPSGHAAVAAAVTTVLWRHSAPGRRWPWPLVAAWVPATRVHLGVHYPSDVAAGAVLGHLLGTGVGRTGDLLAAARGRR